MVRFITLSLLAHSAAANLTGLWTTTYKDSNKLDPLHDAIRIESTTATCEVGGYLNLTALDCSFDAATVVLDSFGAVTFSAGEHESLVRSSQRLLRRFWLNPSRSLLVL